MFPDMPAAMDRPAWRASRWLLVVLALAVLVAAGCSDSPTGDAQEDLPADRYVRDYPSNPGYGRADPPEGTFIDVSAGKYSTCAVRTGGELVCWGDDWGPLPQGRFVRVDIWEGIRLRNGCALADDGSVECWTMRRPEFAAIDRRLGQDFGHDFGQADPPEGAFEQVSVAGRYACGLRTDASVTCWGDNVGEEGYVVGSGFIVRQEDRYRGDDPSEGTYRHHEFWPGGALEVPEGPFVEVHAGMPPCALRPTGELVCWSDVEPYWHIAGRVYGRDYDVFPGAYDKPLASVAPGWGFLHYRGPLWSRRDVAMCGLRPNATLSCRPNDSAGRYLQVSYTSGPKCAIRTDRTLECWPIAEEHSSVSEVPAGEFAHVSAGAHHACAIRVTGTVACWGENSDKPLPDPGPGG